MEMRGLVTMEKEAGSFGSSKSIRRKAWEDQSRCGCVYTHSGVGK